MKYLVLNNKHTALAQYELGINEIDDVNNYLLVSTITLIKIEKNLQETNCLLKSDKSFSFKSPSDLIQGRQRNFTFPENVIIDKVYVNYLNLDIANFISLKMLPENVVKTALDEDTNPIVDLAKEGEVLKTKDIAELRQILKDNNITFFPGAKEQALIKKISENNIKIC